MNNKMSVTKLNCALELERKIIGVKFLFTKEDYNNSDAKQVKSKLNYCVMVKLAMSGYGLKATGDLIECIAGARALGLKEMDDYHKTGQNGKRLGLYRDGITSKNARDNMSYCDHKVYGIMVKPIDDYNEEPDIVIIVSNPYNVMRIVQGYSYYYGVQPNYKMSGNQAICSESTACPYISNDINVSMMCIGTRHRAGWKDNELSVAFPFNRLDNITEGVMKTVNIMDSNEKKQIIEKKLHEKSIDLEIKYNANYYNNN